MVNKWVLSAYKINSGNRENRSIKCNEQKRRSNSQEDDLAEMIEWGKMNNTKYDINETRTMIEEMKRKDTLSSVIDKKVLNLKYSIL